MFPHQLDDPRAFAIAEAIVKGFDNHYELFRAIAREAKPRFERAEWMAQQRAQADRIAFYDLRVGEAVERLQSGFDASGLASETWQQVKLHYIGLLTDHHQPECAETFFNSVTTKILHRSYFRNDFIFVRPALATEYIVEDDRPGGIPTYRAYYPTRETLRETVERVVTNFRLEAEFEDLSRDIDQVIAAILAGMKDVQFDANFQIQVLSSLFFRNKGAYVVGKVVNSFSELPFALVILHGDAGRLVIDTALLGAEQLEVLFSFARAYFMVDMEAPSAYVQFLRSLMPRKTRAELYSQVGLQKQGKNLFYRDLLFHLRHSSDRFRVSPGIKGMVMLVFDLPSFPYVFKVIKDHFPPQKDTTREQVMAKYLFVKHHDRVGRMADTLEFSDVAFPLDRLDDELVAELEQACGSIVERDADALVIHHVYIERRMIPLNIYLAEARSADIEHAVIEYGNAIKDMLAANIFPGDMLWKNFGVTRHNRVVFYDYDEVERLADMNFRRIPTPRNDEEELSGETWFDVGPKDVFPESFGPFLLGNPQVREVFMAHHADLLDAAFWRAHQERIAAGYVHDVFPYDAARRFAVQRAAPQPVAPPAANEPGGPPSPARAGLVR